MQLATLNWQQADGLVTALPLGLRRINALRTLTTEALAANGGIIVIAPEKEYRPVVEGLGGRGSASPLPPAATSTPWIWSRDTAAGTTPWY